MRAIYDSRRARENYLIIKIATNNGRLNIAFGLAIFVVKCNTVENIGQDQNDDEK